MSRNSREEQAPVMNEEGVESYLAQRQFYERILGNQIMDTIDADMIIQIVLRSTVRHNSLRSNFKDQESSRSVKNGQL